MILSSFMRKNVKRKAKAGIPLPPHESPTEPEQVFDINEKAIESRTIQDSSPERDAFDRPSSSSSHTRLNARSPLVQLDYIPEPLEDWFPQELLNGTRGTHNPGWGPIGITSASGPALAEATSSDATKEEFNRAATFQVGHSQV